MDERLEPVTTPADAVVPSGSATPAACEPEQPPPSAESSALVRCPCCRAEYRLSEVILVASGAPLGAEAAEAVTAQAASSPDLKALPEEAASDQSAGQFDFLRGDQDQSPSVAQVVPEISGTRRRKKEPSVLAEVLQAVVGGAVGLFLAYYGLNLFGGQQYDYLKIYLPGVAHTAPHCPAWLREWLAPDHSGEENDFQADTHPGGCQWAVADTDLMVAMTLGQALEAGVWADHDEGSPREPPRSKGPITKCTRNYELRAL